VDGESTQNQTVTIRDRDSLEQWRVKIDDVVAEISQRVKPQ
jgi:glycyl-tRNA synthetase